MGRKKTPSPADEGAPSGREQQEPMTEADRAYAHAVEVCERIIRELEEQLPRGYQKEDRSCPRRP